jgi:hypothetical protein
MHLRAAHIGLRQIGFEEINIVERGAEKIRLFEMRPGKITVIKKGADEFCARQNLFREIELVPGLQGKIETLAAGGTLQVFFMLLE